MKNQLNQITLDVFERKLLLKLPKNINDIQFIRSFNYVKWDKLHFHWVIPNYPGNKERIVEYFGTRIKNVIEHQSESIQLNSEITLNKSKNEVILHKIKSNRVRIIFGFNFELMNFIKEIPYHKWDSTNKW